jgi:hypothetical protein
MDSEGALVREGLRCDEGSCRSALSREEVQLRVSHTSRIYTTLNSHDKWGIFIDPQQIVYMY